MIITMTRHAAVSKGHWCVISVFCLQDPDKFVLQKYGTANWLTGAQALEHEESFNSEADAAVAFMQAIEADRIASPPPPHLQEQVS